MPDQPDPLVNVSDPPTPPVDCPSGIEAQLAEYDPDELRAVAEYAEALAEFQAAQPDDDDETEQDDAVVNEDLPDDVPGKATITVKTINENRYHYWQWREGDDIKSKYKGPVDADE